MENQFSLKELYDVRIKTTYPIEINGKQLEIGETIAMFDRIKIANFEEIKSFIAARGGYSNEGRVFWEDEKEIRIDFQQGIFNTSQFSLMNNAKLLENKEIIRNKLKIKASVHNSKIFKEIVREYSSFYNYLKEFTKGHILYETDKTTNELSDTISKDLQKRGMKFVGSTIIYTYLQAIGVIYSHDKDCFMYKEKRNNVEDNQ